MRTSKIWKLGAVTATMVGVICQSANAGSPNGTWLRPSTGGQIKVSSCGGGLGMLVVKSKDKNKVGKRIMCGAKPTAVNKWQGDIHNLDDGNTYAGYVTLVGAKSLVLKGCGLGGLVCKSEKWKKVQ